MDANGNGIERRMAAVFYPDLMRGNPPPPAMLAPQPATRWAVVDFDDVPPFAVWNARVNGQLR